MKLTVFNGSPRGTGSNTKILLEQFLRGFTETPGNEYEIAYLIHVNRQKEFFEKFRNAESVLLAFPLYTDAMPAVVKTFIESLSPLRGSEDNPHIGFFVQSGFPEAIHSRYVERYLVKLSKRLNCPLYGTAVRGGGESLRSAPVMTKKMRNLFYHLGKDFGTSGNFNPKLVKKLAGQETFPMIGRLVAGIMSRLKIMDMYWDRLLKSNNAYEKRYDKPYQL